MLKIPCFSDEMGRGKSDIWILFDAIKVDGVARARCKNCNHEMINNAERLKSHFIACSKTTGDCSASEGALTAKQVRLIQSAFEVSSTGHTK